MTEISSLKLEIVLQIVEILKDISKKITFVEKLYAKSRSMYTLYEIFSIMIVASQHSP